MKLIFVQINIKFAVYYQRHLLAFQLKFTMFMQKEKQKDTVNIAILYCILLFVTYITK